MGSVGELKNQGCGKVGEVRMKDETFFRSERQSKRDKRGDEEERRWR